VACFAVAGVFTGHSPRLLGGHPGACPVGHGWVGVLTQGPRTQASEIVEVYYGFAELSTVPDTPGGS
jgi:hypothetical protein